MQWIAPGPAGAGVAQQDLDPGEDLGDPEGLGDVVPSPRAEFGHEPAQGLAFGEQQDGRAVRQFGPALPVEVPLVRHVGVEDDQVEAPLDDTCDGLGAGTGEADPVSGQLQGGGEEFGDVGITGDDQDVLAGAACQALRRRCRDGASIVCGPVVAGRAVRRIPRGCRRTGVHNLPRPPKVAFTVVLPASRAPATYRRRRR